MVHRERGSVGKMEGSGDAWMEWFQDTLTTGLGTDNGKNRKSHECLITIMKTIEMLPSGKPLSCFFQSTVSIGHTGKDKHGICHQNCLLSMGILLATPKRTFFTLPVLC